MYEDIFVAPRAITSYAQGKRDFSFDNLLVRIHLIIKIILVDRPFAMGFRIPLSRLPYIYLPRVEGKKEAHHTMAHKADTVIRYTPHDVLCRSVHLFWQIKLRTARYRDVRLPGIRSATSPLRAHADSLPECCNCAPLHCQPASLLKSTPHQTGYFRIQVAHWRSKFTTRAGASSRS